MINSNPTFIPQNPDFEKSVRTSFTRQSVMKFIGAELTKVFPGEVEILLPFKNDLTQHDGFLHAGIISTIVDNACGFAALSLMPANASVLSIEFKVNFMSPAIGEKFLARGKVVKPGRTVTFCIGDVISINGDEQKVIATMTATMIMKIVPK